MNTVSPSTRLPLRAGLLWLLLAAGCAGAPVAVDYDPGVEFLFYRTFAWTGHASVRHSDPESLSGTRVHRVVADALARRGITETDPDEADLWVRYRTEVESQVIRQPRVIGPVPGKPLPPRVGDGLDGHRRYRTYIYVDKTRYYLGTLTIELIDRAAHRVVWQGSTTSAAVRRSDAREPDPKAAARIMAAYPPMHASP